MNVSPFWDVTGTKTIESTGVGAQRSEDVGGSTVCCTEVGSKELVPKGFAGWEPQLRLFFDAARGGRE